ncbi:3-hydroxyacyl-CoA dehydrogenase NAD-binding domain-containing protein [Pannonibacter phragmitetus]|uniref:3-hydroxyacyl-CoA dehydrogenase NAD-binding domain-containing protein n=1 Tax=Pannonibacter phragmitetus TaxID=121719 RepID=UPI000B97BCCA|nr:3-hydroxyacyl-CoA dehydrogenase NAD-binding domain-containing protein [Pannonibacter phragmitetus]
MTTPVSYEVQDGIAVITIANPPVNALSQAVRAGLLEAVARLAGDSDAIAGVITGAGRIFVGGADITEFGKTPQPPYLPDVINAIEDSAKPIAAALNGAAIGGGCEVGLGAHLRIASDTARVSLPEVTLGLMPGAGGTQRLPRLAGVEAALDIITTARQVSAAEALSLGIVDAVVPATELLSAAKDKVRAVAEGSAGRPVASGLRPRPVAEASVFEAARKKVRARNRGEVSHLAAIDAVEDATRMDRAEGLAAERKRFLDLMQTPQRAALIHAFFAERKAAQVKEITGLTPPPYASTGVIGGGTMGAGIATAALLAGLPVTLIEREEAFAEKARATIARNLDGAVARGKLSTEQRDEILNVKLTTATTYEALADADIIIEAVFESLEVKTDVFRTLDAIAKPGATLATNTSYLDVNAIAAVTSRPQDVIGLHFFSPAHVMRLLEIVVAEKTAPAHVARAFDLARKLGKTGVYSGICDGFIGNRLMMQYRLASDYTMMDGASPYEIDAALTDFGFAMGPFQVSDLAGIDIGYASRQRRAPTRPPEERVVTFADGLYHRGWLGQKTGRGFYIYDDQSPKGRPDPEILALLEEARKEAGIIPRSFTADEIQRRYMAAMINEAARVLEEGIARRASDIDTVLLTGYGFPRWRGGPLHYADTVGIASVLDDINRLSADDAYFWRPAPLLVRLAAEGKTFADLDAGEAG